MFSNELWLALAGTGIVLAIFYYIAEMDLKARGVGKSKYPSGLSHGLIEAHYRSFGKLFDAVDEPRVSSVAARVMALAWGLLGLVVMATYTAGLTATLSSRTVKTKISGLSDLPAYRVGTWDAIVDSFLKYNFAPIGLPWDTEDDGLAMIQQVCFECVPALWELADCTRTIWLTLSNHVCLATCPPCLPPPAHDVCQPR